MPSVELLSAYAKLDVKGREKMDRALGGVRKSAISMEAALDKAAVAANRVMLVGAGVIGLSIKQAATAEAQASKFDAVFKDQSKSVEAWAKTYGDAVGRTTLQLKPFLSTLQDTFVPMGFAREEATKMSKQLTQLGLDLASFNDVADAETINLLTSALVGNHEAVRRFGIVITAATLDTELLAMGFNKVTKGATEQQKAQARLNLIMKASSDAQGDLKKTQGEINNQYKKMTGQVQELMVELGKAFIPALNELLPLMTEWAKTIAEWVKENKEAIPAMVKWGAFTLLLVSKGPLAAKAIMAMARGAKAFGGAVAVGGLGGAIKGIGGATAATGFGKAMLAPMAAGSVAAGSMMALFGAQVFNVAGKMAAIDNEGAKLRASMEAERKERERLTRELAAGKAGKTLGANLELLGREKARGMALLGEKPEEVKPEDIEADPRAADRLINRLERRREDLIQRFGQPGLPQGPQFKAAMQEIEELRKVIAELVARSIEVMEANAQENADFNENMENIWQQRQAIGDDEEFDRQQKKAADAVPEAMREFATTSAAGLQGLFQQRQSAYDQKMLAQAEKQNEHLGGIEDGVNLVHQDIGNLAVGFK